MVREHDANKREHAALCGPCAVPVHDGHRGPGWWATVSCGPPVDVTMTGRIRILSTWRGGATDFDRVLSRGNTSDVYAIGVDAVVKVPRPDVPDHWIEIEARHAAAVHEAGLPSPMVLDLTSVNGLSLIHI